MPRYFFTATQSVHAQMTALFDFIWPTAGAMWNLRWQVNGYLQAVPEATVEQLRSRFTEGVDIAGVNFRRSCVEHTWDQQKEAFANVVLVNSIAFFEGWIEAVLGELGRNTRTLNAALQFPDSTARGGKGALWAIGEIATSESDELKSAFYPPLSNSRPFALPKLEAMLLCYRFFKEMRNCSMHGGGVADQRLMDAYSFFSPIATTTALGVAEVPEHFAPTIGKHTRLSLRGVVGLTGIIFKIIATLDAELSRSELSESVFVRRWKSANPHKRMLAADPLKRATQLNKMASNAGLPKPADVQRFGNWQTTWGYPNFKKFMHLNESIIEEAALEWFAELGYAVGHGPQMAPGEVAAERDTFGDVVPTDGRTL